MTGSKPPFVAALALLFLSSLAACGSEEKGESRAALDRHTRRMLTSEAMILQWERSGRLARLSRAVMDLRWPDAGSRDLFAPEVALSGLSNAPPRPDPRADEKRRLLTRLQWSAETESRQVEREALDLWRPWLESVDYLYRGKFKVYLPVPRWLDEGMTRWQCWLLFTGTARMKNGRRAHVRARQEVVWERPPDADTDAIEEAAWRIVQWRQLDFTTTEVEHPFFEESLGAAIVDPDVLEHARRSRHEEKVVEYLRDPEVYDAPHELFRPEAVDRHPAVSVVDLDRDGFDDFYVMARWGPNLFFRNRGAGRFEEVGAELGLDIEDHCSSAVFADFDNDGDDDLFLGRTLETCRYLRNDGGRFVDRSEELVPLPGRPYFVSSLAAADFDGDGWLDLYISTYAGDLVQRAMLGRRGKETHTKWIDVLKRYVSEEDGAYLEQEILASGTTSRFYTAAPGPANVLLRNRGGRGFELDRRSPQLRVYRNTYQSSWADYDDDGDPDLYCANDFSSNTLFRNDGQGRFVDVTEDTGTADIGFGMGASWGDYDKDGRQDLYVANMFSKAGRRVTSYFTEGGANYDPAAMSEGIDPIFRRMAGGNSLFHNEEARFRKVSGMAPPALMVEESGWSWGGQFADFDNDGYLDLYSLSGYYTAPNEAAIQVDL